MTDNMPILHPNMPASMREGLRQSEMFLRAMQGPTSRTRRDELHVTNIGTNDMRSAARGEYGRRLDEMVARARMANPRGEVIVIIYPRGPFAKLRHKRLLARAIRRAGRNRR